jgi:hypothetical protein
MAEGKNLDVTGVTAGEQPPTTRQNQLGEHRE